MWTWMIMACVFYLICFTSYIRLISWKSSNPETKWWRSKCCEHKNYPVFIKSFIIFISYNLSAHWIRKYIFLLIIWMHQYTSFFEIKCNITFHVSLTFKGSTSMIVSSAHSKMNCNRMQSNNCCCYCGSMLCQILIAEIFTQVYLRCM